VASGDLKKQLRHCAVSVRFSPCRQEARSGRQLLDAALCHLLLGKASRPGKAEARTHFDRALDELRNAGQLHYIPRGLLASAADFRLRNAYDRAEEDLAETLAMSEKCGMRFHKVDALIERSRLNLARGNRSEAATDCATARDLAGMLDPRFRRSMLSDLTVETALA
jgi:hypothetical protein